EPQKPSTRLHGTSKSQNIKKSKQVDARSSVENIARRRRMEPGALRKRLRGDLDWIVMKCLEKNRTRRYETASNLAADVERHLKNEPVAAGPPNTLYTLRKFVTRNKWPAALGVT